MKKLLYLAVMFLAITVESHAQVDTINATNKKLLVNELKEGTKDYLVYMIDSVSGKRTVGDIWQRSVKFSTRNAQPVVAFEWNWLHSDTSMAYIVNICDRKTLSPIYHHANYKGRGVFAYDYRDGFMLPSDTIPKNFAVKKGKVELSIPILSWELDLETYSLLPIKKVGQQFDISFFDPNEKKPTYHRYAVIGKEELQLNADTKIKCWLLKINYTADSYATFWLTEKSKDVIKMKEYYKGKYRVKVRQF